jgi:hypothetical protein
MTGVAAANPRQQFFDSAGNPLVGGFVDVYLAGTTTRTDTWRERTLIDDNKNTNPIELDARGECTLWLDETVTYKLVVKDADGAVQYTSDNVVGAAGFHILADVVDAQATALAAIAADEASALAAIEAQETTSVAAVVAAQDTAETAVDALVTQAEAAETNAEAARDSLIAAAGIFADTTAGLAATASGGYFWVPSAVAEESYILYLDDAGVAVEKKRLPSATAFTSLAVTGVADAEYAIQDGNGNAAMLIEDGVHKFADAEAESFNGIKRADLARRLRRQDLFFSASIVHHISYGQSLSLGNGGSMVSLPNVDGGFFDSVRFNANGTVWAGPRAQEGSGTVAQNHASLVPYEEGPLTGGTPTGNVETPLGNSLRMVKRLLRDEDGILHTDFDYILLGSAPGLSNTSITGLEKPTAPYLRLVNEDVTYGLALAQAAGKTFAVDVIHWFHGERDIQDSMARATYLSKFQQLYTDLNTDIKAITGQAHDIKIIAYQCSYKDQPTNNVALAQLDAAKANPNIIIATASYAVEHLTPTQVHLAGIGYAHLGAYHGLAVKRTVIEQGEWPAMYPRRLLRQGVILEAEWPDIDGYALATGTELFPDVVANHGFTVVGLDGVTDNPVVSATVVAPRRVRIVLTNALPGKLRYGFSSWGGNLYAACDIDPGLPREVPLYLPCLTFEESFA